MTPMAQPLSDADIQNLAAYYASLSCRTVPSTTRIGDAAAGKALAKNCAACHGETGIAGNPAWPQPRRAEGRLPGERRSRPSGPACARTR